ncbi:hypothetical protein F5B19DRAFT_342687 [Rostrohypoxylon terebratum]|nr:hypothetical protein F5B19DRAFT_342687 [Rostrohypoxylon terebratum]
MMKSGLSLLLLWSLWSTTGLGFGDFASSGDGLRNREQSDDGIEPVAVRWVVTERDDESRLPSITAAPIAPKAISPDGNRVQIRQTTTKTDDDDDDDDDGPRTPPTPPPGAPNPAQDSTSISNSVSASVSSSVAASVTNLFTSSLQALSVASVSAVISARQAGILEGISSVTAGVRTPITTAVSSPTTSVPSSTSIASSATATNTDTASDIANIQTSASKAVEEAQASASISAQSAVAAAQASMSAVMANASPPSSSSRLTPGQIAGIVISIAFTCSLISALATFLIMRRRAQQQQDPPSNYEPDTLYASRTQEPILPPVPEPRPHSLSQSIRNRLSSFQAMFGAPIMPPYRRSQSPTPSNANMFNDDMKQRPPTAEHPAMAMSHNARPLSDPVFPVSPVSSIGGQSLFPQTYEPEARLQPSPPVPVIVEAAASPVPYATTASARTSAMPARVSLAREQSLTKKQRPQLVRVGSGREANNLAGGAPLSMNPVRVDTRFDVAPVSATGQGHMMLPMPSPMEGDGHGGWRTSAGTELSSTSPFQVQAPVPRRLVDPVSLEQRRSHLSYQG